MPNTGHYCENTKAWVCWGHMAADPATYFSKEDQPAWVTLKDPSHLRQEEISRFWDFWYSRQLAGKMGLVFSGCDKRDKRNHMGAGKKFFQAQKKGKGRAIAHGMPQENDGDKDDEDQDDDSIDEDDPDDDQDGSQDGSQPPSEDEETSQAGDHSMDVDGAAEAQSGWSFLLHQDFPINVSHTKDDRMVSSGAFPTWMLT